MKIYEKDLFAEISQMAKTNEGTGYKIHVENEQERIANVSEMAKYYKPILQKIINDCMVDGTPLFGNLMLSTVNRCNGLCSFCAANAQRDDRTFHQMSDELLQNIFEQLAELKYHGRITLNGLNEPFMDCRMVDIIKNVAKAVPTARIHIITNGTLLNEDMLEQIIPYCTKIHVNCYGDGISIPSKIKSWGEKYSSYGVLKIEPRYREDILSQFGNNDCGRMIVSGIDCACILPFNTISITSDGKVNLCISDRKKEFVVGDINKQSLIEIWYGKELQSIRRAMNNGRNGCKLCKDCDMFCF